MDTIAATGGNNQGNQYDTTHETRPITPGIAALPSVTLSAQEGPHGKHEANEALQTGHSEQRPPGIAA